MLSNTTSSQIIESIISILALGPDNALNIDDLCSTLQEFINGPESIHGDSLKIAKDLLKLFSDKKVKYKPANKKTLTRIRAEAHFAYYLKLHYLMQDTDQIEYVISEIRHSLGGEVSNSPEDQFSVATIEYLRREHASRKEQYKKLGIRKELRNKYV